MKIGILLFAIFLSLLNKPIFSQTKSDTVNENSIKYKYALGIGAGYSTGYGLSFKFTPNKFGIQTIFGPFSNSDIDQFSIGITLLYTLIDAEITSFYLYQGNNFIYSIYHPFQYDGLINRKTKYFNNGVGFGIEFDFCKYFSFNLMCGYAFYENFKRLGLTGETSLYFKF